MSKLTLDCAIFTFITFITFIIALLAAMGFLTTKDN